MRKCDALKNIKVGSHIRVEGYLDTFHHKGGSKDNPSPFPAAWVIYMDVEKVTVLSPPKPTSKPLASQCTPTDISLVCRPVIRLTNTGDLGGKYINEIVAEGDVTRIIILKNNTSAPNQLHISGISRILRANPKIESFYFIDTKSGHRTRSYESEVHGFFSALLVTKSGDYIGFELSKNKARVFNQEGDGLIAR